MAINGSWHEHGRGGRQEEDKTIELYWAVTNLLNRAANFHFQNNYEYDDLHGFPSNDTKTFVFPSRRIAPSSPPTTTHPFLAFLCVRDSW